MSLPAYLRPTIPAIGQIGNAEQPRQTFVSLVHLANSLRTHVAVA
ncbi:hypothetical protein I547_0705 [Mycobacterium kansasii 824]|uniref:Uncharacterized protein n=1 Tax=Mycobacterium kansasii TaxID=1768 RepID=A0A1V3XVL3_MYCKA|nr:hypothetical protein I547_0705 [Mycobacterium kansasii 824]KEP43174.1 hypothetical protein MKSMC1_15610 [Mycobacterium kansasii]OOK83245.1 hypothetical protein BZL29_0749 [Mycobacterium kansasii]